MPRWLLVVLTLGLFAVAMAAVRLVLGVVVPPFDRWTVDLLGPTGSLVLTFAVIAALGIIGFWPRDAAGRMRRLLPPRR